MYNSCSYCLLLADIALAIGRYCYQQILPLADIGRIFVSNSPKDAPGGQQPVFAKKAKKCHSFKRLRGKNCDNVIHQRGFKSVLEEKSVTNTVG